MQIRHLYRRKKPVLSFEIFPPKKDSSLASLYPALDEMAALSPDYISVTYGAGGGGNMGLTGEIASRIKKNCDIEALAHLTCVKTDRATIHSRLDDLAAGGIRNVLAMRGDLPTDADSLEKSDYRYAADLIADIADRGDFCIGAACYPEGHIDCATCDESIEHLKQKQDAGADFLITQLFFDNTLFWRFWEKAQAAGIDLPISAGVMPILSRSQIERMIFLCGASLPSSIIKLLHKYADNPSDLRKAGIEYAVRQMEELVAGGVDGIHAYTMNHPDIAGTVMRRLRP